MLLSSQLAGQISGNFPKNILIGTHFENLRKLSEIWEFCQNSENFFVDRIEVWSYISWFSSDPFSFCFILIFKLSKWHLQMSLTYANLNIPKLNSLKWFWYPKLDSELKKVGREKSSKSWSRSFDSKQELGLVRPNTWVAKPSRHLITFFYGKKLLVLFHLEYVMGNLVSNCTHRRSE